MNTPSLDDRIVNVRAFLTDERFGHTHWQARQFCSPDGAVEALLVIVRPNESRDELRARVATATGAQP